MTEQPAAPVVQTPVEVALTSTWREASSGAVTVSATGYGAGADAPALAGRLAALGGAYPAPNAIARLLDGLSGHFAFVATGPRWSLIAVDPVRSIPLAYARSNGAWRIDARADRLRRALGLGVEAVDPEAALALAMAGYTVDAAALYRGVEVMGPGEFVLLRDGEPNRQRYHAYRPWRADKPTYDAARARKALAETVLSVVDTMMAGIGGRELVVPLSAGRDSRLIVSAARHLGHKNIRCFAYGRPGNHEIAASRAIAERLGYRWTCVPMDVPFMRRFYASADYRGYLDEADTLQACPFVQDMPQIMALKEAGFIPCDAVFANGNTGDFLSGGHVVPAIREPAPQLDVEARLTRIVEALIDKHFALWRGLATAENRRTVTHLLHASFAQAGAAPGASEDDYGLFEYAEFCDRQCKYVINGQRVYEALGHEWRLPLWDRELLDFFELVPLAGKAEQTLYGDMLDTENWGGVWQGLPVNAKTIRPHWLSPLRFAAKTLHAPLGGAAWHRFERRYLQYWMETGAQSAIVPYRRAAADRRGARHGIAWLTEAYLERHGLGWNGAPLAVRG